MKPFIPADFKVPDPLQTEHFRIRMLTVNDVVKDYDAVMSSVEHLETTKPFGTNHNWPRELTFEQDLIDLGWHQKEFQLRSSFDYAVMSLDETRLLGCVYIDPARKTGTQADIWFWVRQSEIENGLESILKLFLLSWLAESWPFNTVTFNGTLKKLNSM